MKKSSAPSVRTKAKMPTVHKAASDPPLKAKQIRILQTLIAAVSFHGVLDSTQDNIENAREMTGKYYHGYDSDHVGQARLFLEAKFRFKVLW